MYKVTSTLVHWTAVSMAPTVFFAFVGEREEGLQGEIIWNLVIGKFIRKKILGRT